MARGRLFSRKYEPAKPRPLEELEKSRNPLVQLGLAFKRLQKLAPEAAPTLGSGDRVNVRRPLVDIDEVRQYMREKMGITREISTIPLPHSSRHAGAHLHSPGADASSSETAHMSPEHTFSSGTASLPVHDAAPGTRAFDIGTVGHPIVEADESPGTVSSSSFDQPFRGISKMEGVSFRSPARRDRQPTTTTLEVSDMERGASTRFEVTDSGTDQPSAIVFEVDEASRLEQASTTYTWVVEPPSTQTRLPQLDMRDVHEFMRGVVELYKRCENWGLPETSWENKMPWHSPPPEILSRPLQRPPQRFASEEERLEFNRLARKQRKFLSGCPPTWSFMVANLALVAFLVYNPLG